MAKRAVGTALGQAAAIATHVLGVLFIDIGQISANQCLGSAVHEVKVVRGEVLIVLAEVVP